MDLQSGLSFNQAPPILVPFRFFLSAPLFSLLAALLVLWFGPSLLDSRWHPSVLATTHLVTLGFLGMVMIGAMMQMLPVVAGAPVAHPVGVARTTHWLIIPGILFLAIGFLLSAPLLMKLAMSFLGTGMLVFIAASGLSVWRTKSDNPTLTGMRFAIFGLLITVIIGLTLASNYGWTWWISNRIQITNLHVTWGLLGWISMLVIGVSYQVVPMFQLTPYYPKPITRWLSSILFLLLLSGSASTLLLPQGNTQNLISMGIELLVTTVIAGFAATTLQLQFKRRRKQSDVTLLFWRFGMTCLLLALMLHLATQIMPGWIDVQRANFMMAFLFLAGFAVSVVNGMLYKIAPFLIWFHLQSLLMGIAKVPNMKRIMPEPGMRRQMWLHFTAIPALTLSVLWPPMIYLAALLFAASMILLEINLLTSFRLYQQNAKLATKNNVAN